MWLLSQSEILQNYVKKILKLKKYFVPKNKSKKQNKMTEEYLIWSWIIVF